MASLDADAPAVEDVNAGAAAEAEVGGDDVAGLAKAELEKVQAELTAYEEKVAAAAEQRKEKASVGVDEDDDDREDREKEEAETTARLSKAVEEATAAGTAVTQAER